MGQENHEVNSTLRVLSYNIHKGWSWNNRRNTLEPIRHAIRSVAPDIVFLQEVQGSTSPAQFEYVADEMWSHFAYGKNAIYEDGHHGNAILSKYPFVEWENIDITSHWSAKRGILHGVIEIPPAPASNRKRVHLLCLHFGLFALERMKQLELLCERVQKQIPPGESVIIGGDFNDWREHLSHRLEERLQVREVFQALTGQHARSFPAQFPLLHLDRIYTKGLIPQRALVKSEPEWRGLSDHLPIVCELCFEGGKPAHG